MQNSLPWPKLDSYLTLSLSLSIPTNWRFHPEVWKMLLQIIIIPNYVVYLISVICSEKLSWSRLQETLAIASSNLVLAATPDYSVMYFKFI